MFITRIIHENPSSFQIKDRKSPDIRILHQNLTIRQRQRRPRKCLFLLRRSTAQRPAARAGFLDPHLVNNVSFYFNYCAYFALYLMRYILHNAHNLLLSIIAFVNNALFSMHFSVIECCFCQHYFAYPPGGFWMISRTFFSTTAKMCCDGHLRRYQIGVEKQAALSLL